MSLGRVFFEALGSVASRDEGSKWSLLQTSKLLPIDRQPTIPNYMYNDVLGPPRPPDRTHSVIHESRSSGVEHHNDKC